MAIVCKHTLCVGLLDLVHHERHEEHEELEGEPFSVFVLLKVMFNRDGVCMGWFRPGIQPVLQMMPSF